jgi:surface protein
MITKYELRDKILKNEDISGIDYSHITNMYNMFNGCSRLKTIPNLDTSNVTEMSQMFYSCSSLKTIPKLDTSNVTNMSYMFGGCSELKEVQEFDTSEVTNMSGMFYGCSSLKTIPFADKIKDLEATKLPFLKELESLPDIVKIKLLMSPSDNKDKKIQAMIKLYKD